MNRQFNITAEFEYWAEQVDLQGATMLDAFAAGARAAANSDSFLVWLNHRFNHRQKTTNKIEAGLATLRDFGIETVEEQSPFEDQIVGLPGALKERL